MHVIVNTPAGNIGRVVMDRLLACAQQVTMISRNPEKVRTFADRGARLVVGSFDDPAVLDRAMTGADALLWLTPLVFDQPRFLEWARTTGRLAADTARRNGVRRAVLISSVGAQHESGVGPIACMPAIEAVFKACVPNVMSLRAGHFMENLLVNVPTIAQSGAIYSPYPTDRKIPLVAARDVAAVAAEALLDPGWTGFRIKGVHGAEDIDYATAAEIVGKALGRPVRHVEVSIDAARQAMLEAGVPEHVVELLAELYAGIRDGRVARAEPRTAETTTPTTLLEFARQVLKPAVERPATA